MVSVVRNRNWMKFVFFLASILLFQWWLMNHHKNEFVFAEFPGKESAVIETNLINDSKSESETKTNKLKNRFYSGWIPIALENKIELLMKTSVGSIIDYRTKEILWTYSGWLPDVIETKFYQISRVRRGSLNSGGNTLIDKDIWLKSTAEFVRYLPRAIQVGLLSPFPEFWSGEGSTTAMTIARKIVGAVTFVYYIFLIGLLCALIKHIRNVQFLSILIFCLPAVMLYSYSYANVGALLRFRYGFYMLLVSFGLAFIVQFVQTRTKKINH